MLFACTLFPSVVTSDTEDCSNDCNDDVVCLGLHTWLADDLFVASSTRGGMSKCMARLGGPSSAGNVHACMHDGIVRL